MAASSSTISCCDRRRSARSAPPASTSRKAACEANGGTWIPGVADGAYYQLVTSMFTHVQLWHIGFNMFALYALGPQLELVVGRARFIALYFLSGLAGSALVYWGDRGRLRRLRCDLRPDGRAR